MVTKCLLNLEVVPISDDVQLWLILRQYQQVCSWTLRRQVRDAAVPPVPAPSPDNVAEAAKGNRSFSAKQRTARKRIAIAADALSTAARVDVPDVPKDDATTELIGARQTVCNPVVRA